MERRLTVIGGGLAGCEAAVQAAVRGVRVTLYEMRPGQPTPAHKTADLAELVCSNGMGALDPASAPGLLKEEMRQLGSVILDCARQAQVPAGGALGVDRLLFAQKVTEKISQHPNITLLREEVKAIPDDGVVVVATGPLTSDALAESIRRLTQADALYFFDAISPIIDTESIDQTLVFRASRYGKGGDDYLNCPMDEAEYDAFYRTLLSAERVVPKSFEKTAYFEACLPIEVLADRGRLTPVFGPMKPVGLIDPKRGRQPFAVVQLRTENVHRSAHNMVGFQTQLKWPEQKRVFRMIPGLAAAEFFRMGSIHRNTFINAPRLLSRSLQVRTRPGLFMAGQLVGVEGYVESAAMGYLVGMNAARLLSGESPISPPPTTAHGALIGHLVGGNPANFQPMNINFGLFPPLPDGRGGKILRRQQVVDRAMEDISRWIAQYKITDATSP